jgi:predicted DNA-binding transcriptional regulator AlpA
MREYKAIRKRTTLPETVDLHHKSVSIAWRNLEIASHLESHLSNRLDPGTEAAIVGVGVRV